MAIWSFRIDTSGAAPTYAIDWQLNIRREFDSSTWWIVAFDHRSESIRHLAGHVLSIEAATHMRHRQFALTGIDWQRVFDQSILAFTSLGRLPPCHFRTLHKNSNQPFRFSANLDIRIVNISARKVQSMMISPFGIHIGHPERFNPRLLSGVLRMIKHSEQRRKTHRPIIRMHLSRRQSAA